MADEKTDRDALDAYFAAKERLQAAGTAEERAQRMREMDAAQSAYALGQKDRVFYDNPAAGGVLGSETFVSSGVDLPLAVVHTPPTRVMNPKGYPYEQSDLTREFVVETPPGAREGLAKLLPQIEETKARILPLADDAQKWQDKQRVEVLKVVDQMRRLGVSPEPVGDLDDAARFIRDLLAQPPIFGTESETRPRLSRQDLLAQRQRVKGMQQDLAEKGFYLGEINGVYDAKTVDAIRAAQRAGMTVPTTVPGKVP